MSFNTTRIEELNPDDLKITANIAANIGVFDVLPLYRFKNFVAVKKGIKFNIPTNKYKANRCTILGSSHYKNIYTICMTSEYYDNKKQKFVINVKQEFSNLSIKDTTNLLFKELINQ